MTVTATVVGGVLLALVCCFQVGLALGAPWGAAAYGGRAAGAAGVLPPAYRVSSAAAALLLAAAGWVVWARVEPLLWLLAGLFALNTVANLAGRHPVERWGMGPATLLLTGCCVALAVG